MPQSRRTAIIGAGLSGLACARSLTDAGFAVTVFDKGRRPGGRLATREISGGSFDHGAQFANPETPEFAQFLEASTHAAPWPQLQTAGKPDTHVFQPTTNALAASLAVGLDIAATTQITRLSLETKEGWRVAASDGRTFGPFDGLVVAIPAPQATDLLGPYAAPFADALGTVAYDPCMVAMLGYAKPVAAPAPIIEPPESDIALAVRDSAKPGRNHDLDCWVIQARLDWSRAHADDEKASIAEALLGAFRHLVPTATNIEPAYLEGHRWRYALVRNAIGEPCLHDRATHVTLAGDYLLGANAEHAYLSGRAAARAILGET